MLALALIMSASGLLLVLGEVYIRYKRWHEAYAALGREHAETAGRLRLIEAQFPQPMVMMDARGLIRRVNPAAEALLGYTEEELFGHNILRILPIAPSAHNVSSPLRQRAAARIAARGMHRAETEIRCKDGSRVWVHTTGMRSEAEGRSDLYMFFETSEAMQAASAKAAEPGTTMPEAAKPALGTLERVVGRIVGQFEELLTTINGYGELARYGTPTDSPVRKDLEEIVAAGERASHLARNLMAFSGKQRIPMEAVELNDVVRGTVGEISGAVELEWAAEGSCVLANAECLHQVILVLAEGAVLRMAGQPGSLKIGTSLCTLEQARATYSGEAPAGTYGIVTISDSGAFIGVEVLAQMFEPLYLNRELLGVDLSPIYGIVHSLGGRLDVSSAERQGTKFEILLPVTPRQPEGIAPRAHAAVINGSV